MVGMNVSFPICLPKLQNHLFKLQNLICLILFLSPMASSASVNVAYQSGQVAMDLSSMPPVTLRLAAIHRGITPLERALMGVNQQPGQLTLEYRNRIAEWYRWDQQGVEQGLTLSQPLDSDTSRPLYFDYDLGTHYRARQQGEDVILQHQSSGRQIHFGHLVAFDSHGKRLPAWMQATETGFRLALNDQGAAYPIIIDPYFSEVTDLQEPGLANGEIMGQGMDQEGDLLAVGTYQRVLLYQKNAQQGWDRIATLTGPEASVRFGLFVKIENDVVVVSDHACNTSGASSAGIVYVYQKPAGGWADTSIPTAELTPTTSSANQMFGIGLDVEGDTVVVSGSGSDAAWVFEKPAGGWANMHETAKLADNTEPGFKNRNVAIRNDIIYVAGYTNNNATNPPLDNTGEVHVYNRSGLHWTDQNPDTRLQASVSGDDRLGDELLTDGNSVYVSATNKTVQGTRAGAVFIFEMPVSGWPANLSETTMLTAPVLNDNAIFGRALALDGTSLAVAASLEDVNITNGHEGAVYVFTRQGASWLDGYQSKRLVLPDATDSDYFATTLLLDQQAGILMGGISRVLQQVPLVKGPIKQLQTTADIAIELQTAKTTLTTSEAFSLNTTLSNLDNEVELPQVSLSISLPTQLVFDGTPAGCVQNSATEMTCSQANVAAGAVLLQAIPLKSTTASGNFSIQASVSGNYKDSTMQNNTASLAIATAAPAATNHHDRIIHKRGGSLSYGWLLLLLCSPLLRRRLKP